MICVPSCPRCREGSRLVDAAEVYGYRNSYPPVYVCTNFPECDFRVGCHPGTIKPLGNMADSATRSARNLAHAAFDPIWKTRRKTRHGAYRWLADKLGMNVNDVHIANFDERTCRRVVKICESWHERHKIKGGL